MCGLWDPPAQPSRQLSVTQSLRWSIWGEIFLKNKFIYLFIIYFWLHWVFVAAHGLSLVAVRGLLIAVAFLVAEFGV